jgi:predicted transglutaminase-like cysteine proteinase
VYRWVWLGDCDLMILRRPIAERIFAVILFAGAAPLLAGCSALVGPAGKAGKAQTATIGSAPPLGYRMLCLHRPAECRGGGTSSVVATAAIMATLRGVNARINTSITPRRDGAADIWSLNATTGDCEEYVLAKRQRSSGPACPRVRSVSPS